MIQFQAKTVNQAKNLSLRSTRFFRVVFDVYSIFVHTWCVEDLEEKTRLDDMALCDKIVRPNHMTVSVDQWLGFPNSSSLAQILRNRGGTLIVKNGDFGEWY